MREYDCTHNELGLLYQWHMSKGHTYYAANCVAEMERRSVDTVVLESITAYAQRVLEFHHGILTRTDYVTTYERRASI